MAEGGGIDEVGEHPAETHIAVLRVLQNMNSNVSVELGPSERSLELVQSYPWPGNIRELQNVIERSVIVCETENLSVDESWLSRQPHVSRPQSDLGLSRKHAAQEKEIIEAALRESGGRVAGASGAAAKLGIPGSTLESKIRSLKINKHRFKTTILP